MDLGAFGQRAAHASSVEGLADCFFDAGTEALRTAFIGMEVREPEGMLLLGRNLPPGMERYERVGRQHDPVLAAITCLHAPQAMSIRELRVYVRRHRLPDAYMELLDYDVGRHYMAAPIIVGGVVAGVLRFARREDRPFGARELAIASALSLHVSTRMTTLRARAAFGCEQLSERSLEVAELAAAGMTTAEVGRALGVTANTVKKHLRIIYERLGVGSRVELALKMPAAPLRM